MPRPPQNDAPVIPPALKALGMVLLVAALGSAVMLALDHFDLTRAPGCGPRSGCDQAARSAWGSIPTIGYPTSLAGVAFFAAALAGWIACTRGVPQLFRAVVWLGGAMSVVFIIAMISGGYVCKYCLAAHIANLAFVGVMEASIRRGSRSPSLAPFTLGTIVFIVASIALAAVHVQTESRREARDEAERQESLGQLMGSTPRKIDEPIGVATTATQPRENQTPFTGRWLLGLQNAPIRIVMFTDYQCPDCRQMEQAAMALVEQRKDVSLSVKHFPMCAMCNRHSPNLHPNACWAARAAETAGQLYGNDGFWKMHRWLFSRGGSFTDTDLPPALQQLGFDSQRFLSHMQTQPTLAPVLADIEEAIDLGLFITPMIFINGVELRGFIGNPSALTVAVDQLAARGLAAGSPSQDHPPKAARKYVEDWANGARMNVPPTSNPHTLGPADAKAQVIVFGDLQDRFTAELDRAIRSQMSAGRSIRYEFRHYPVDRSCNPNVQQTVYPSSCMAARAAEAAGMLGGNAAFWKMQEWLLAHQSPLSNDLLKQAAAGAGVDGDALLAKMSDPALNAALNQSVQQTQPLILHGFVPSLYVNGRWVPRWKLEGANIFDSIVKAAERE